ncbi:MAG: gfo/Idh/MocA family oxidoreductase, partial [Gemmatimonadota bacterium]
MKREHGRPLRVAFLGCGLAARIHSRTLKRFGSQIERCYASRSPRKATESLRRWGGVAAFGSYEEALADP